MLKSTNGFTLMEILVVVTIIGILAAIAVPSYIHAVDKGRKEACATNIQSITTQVERYKLEKGRDIGARKDIVTFLQEKGYLLGPTIKCPYAQLEDGVSGITYDLDANGKVTCSNCSTDDD